MHAGLGKLSWPTNSHRRACYRYSSNAPRRSDGDHGARPKSDVLVENRRALFLTQLLLSM